MKLFAFFLTAFLRLQSFLVLAQLVRVCLAFLNIPGELLLPSSLPLISQLYHAWKGRWFFSYGPYPCSDEKIPFKLLTQCNSFDSNPFLRGFFPHPNNALRSTKLFLQWETVNEKPIPPNLQQIWFSWKLNNLVVNELLCVSGLSFTANS